MPTSPRPGWSRFAFVGGVGVAMLLLAACGSSAKTSSGTTTTVAPASGGAGGGAVTIEEHSVGSLGNVLVNQDGRTLYLLTSETASKLTCTSSACLSNWPPVTLPSGTSAATAGMGADASKLGTAKGPSGDTWVTYNGWPLHTFAGDSAAGTANGEGISSFGGTWEALTTAGTGVAPGGGGSTTTLYHY